MKIAVFTDTYLPQINGVAISTRTFKQEYEALGHQVVVIGPKVDRSSRSTATVWRFKSMPFPFQPEYRMISPLSRKLRLFKRLKFDVIHIQTPFFMGHLGQYLGWKHKIPVVHTYHTLWSEYLHYFPLVPKRLRHTVDLLVLSRTFCNRCQHVLVPSEAIQSHLQSYGVQTPMTVLPTGVSLERIEQHGDPAVFRHHWGIAPDDPVAIFVGRLGMEKNVMFLLAAFHSLTQRMPALKLVVVGDGPERQDMIRWVHEYGVADRVVFTGYLSHHDVFTAYAASDVILFPSKTETQGLSLIEGLSLGKPAVCINEMGVRLMTQGGFLTSDSLDDYVEAAYRLFQDRALYTQKSAEAQALARSYSSKEMARKALAVYDTLISTT
ncbi:glycosyltransferase family 4 protein [bacterium]|nr:glycosyltransferase family 4 protein [bacterium]